MTRGLGWSSVRVTRTEEERRKLYATERIRPNELRKHRVKIRQQLGFCTYCLEPALPEFKVCVKHKEYERERGPDRKERRITKRGYRIVRIPV